MLSLDSWLSLIRNEIVPLDMPMDVSRAFFYYLADRGMFESGAGELWRMTSLDSIEPPTAAIVASRLDDLIQTDKIIPYFLRSKSDLADIFSVNFDKPAQSKSLQERKVSDLSNLQIVKKIGRQLEPFIELEKKFLNYVAGPNTNKESARVLLNYVLERARGKANPRAWEQLSRRRHV